MVETRKCVAMVTAYYTVKKYCGAGVLITFSDISSYHRSQFRHFVINFITMNVNHALLYISEEFE